MYCGDETGAFIGDIGSHTCRFGYGGEDNPKYVVPSYSYSRHGHSRSDSSSNNNNNNRQNNIPSSSLHFRGNVTPIYRMADICSNVNENEPQVNPNAYLQQGDYIQSWDAFQNVWSAAMDVMHVHDTFKHTNNDSSIEATATTAAGGTTSETIRSSSSGGSGSCPHPLLAIDSGCTAIVDGSGTSSPDAAADEDTTTNNSNYNKSSWSSSSSWQHRNQRLQMTEVFMEAMDASAVFIVPTPMVAAFSYGRQTATVVDVGAGGCRVSPVVDGLLLRNAQRRNGRGGDWLANVQWQAVLSSQDNATPPSPIQPRYLLRDTCNNVTATADRTFRRWAMQELMYEFRTSDHVHLSKWRSDVSTPFIYNSNEGNTIVGGDTNADPTMRNVQGTAAESSTGESSAVPPAQYQLPDGTIVDLTTRIGKDMCRLPELFFTDNVPFVGDNYSQRYGRGVVERYYPSSSSSSSPTLSNLPLHKLVHDSLTAVGDADLRKELCGNIVLVGGSSLFPNMEQRLSYEVGTVVPGTYKCRVVASRTNVERSYASWIGGSILTSLGSFQQLWLSKKEYDEYGANLALQRFPS